MLPIILISHFSSRIKNRESSGWRMLALPKRSTYLKLLKRELKYQQQDTGIEIETYLMEYKTLKFIVTILKIMEDLQRVVFVMILHIKETSHCVPILTK